MSLWTNLKDAFRRKKSRDFARELTNQFFNSPICSDYENLFAQVRPLIDEMKAVVPYGIGRNGARLPDSRTPELSVLHDPNYDMGWAEFADLMFATWLTEDELDIHVWEKNGKVVGYTILPPESRMYLGYGKWQWQVMTTDGLEILTEDNVMRLRYSRSPRDPERGVSPASAVRVWAQIDDLISQYQKAYFENGAVPATITFITASTRDKYEATRKELENKLKGARNHNKTVFAWRQFDNDSGQSVDQVEVKTIQGNNSTLAIKDIISIVNDRLNKSVGVSNFILGDDSSAKYDNAELSDHQFTKRRVYPALMSFWNQFQHELDRITGGIGYGISFDLEIPELTEREKVKADIARTRSEALVNLISAGASAKGAVMALGLSDKWMLAANGIEAKGSAGELIAPISVDYSKPKAIEATTDKAEQEPKKADIIHGHNCKCHKDKLPPMDENEQKAYKILIDLADSILNNGNLTTDQAIDRLVEVLIKDAEGGAVDGMKALELLTDGDVADEITKLLGRDVFISEGLTERLQNRASDLVKGYDAYTRNLMNQVLDTSEGLSANEIKARLAEVMPTSRAESIARNETVYAIKSGRLEQDQALAGQFGLNIRLVWRTSGDKDVCPICAGMEGKTVDLGQVFDDSFIAGERLSKEQLEYYKLSADDVLSWEQSKWNDGGRIPDSHVGCRCYFDEELV